MGGVRRVMRASFGGRRGDFMVPLTMRLAAFAFHK